MNKRPYASLEYRIRKPYKNITEQIKGHYIKLEGQTFGDLIAIYSVGLSSSGTLIWLCKCKCGREKLAETRALRNLQTTRCKECLTRHRKKNNTTHGVHDHPIYFVWRNMMARCYNPKIQNYRRYGAKGIRVCKRWHNAANFVLDMGESHEKDLYIDRIDGSGNYNPSNCRWADASQSNRNRSMPRKSKYRGVYNKSSGKRRWVSRLDYGESKVFSRCFYTEEEAGRAYDRKVYEIFGKQPYMNFPGEYRGGYRTGKVRSK